MSTELVRFTKPVIPRLTCPAGKAEAFHWDHSLPGFGLRAYSSGRRQWIAQYRDGDGRTRRASLGDLKVVSLDEAKTAARNLLSRVELGVDPQAEKRAARKAIRLSALVEAYLEDAKGRLKPRSYIEVERHLKKHTTPLHHSTAASVDRADIARLLAGISKASGPVAGNRVRSSLSAMWVWGLRSGTIEGENPVANVPKPGNETPRERVLTNAELALVWQCTASEHDHDRIVRMLMLTGARREEVAAMEWGEVFGPLWVLPSTRSKNGMAHEVPLGPTALAQLPARREGRTLIFGEGTGGFSGWSRCKERLDVRILKLLREIFQEQHGRAPAPDEITSPAWTLHDLRRTVSTWLNENGTEPHVVEAVLNHVSGGAKRGVAGVYNKAQYREPKRAALVRWETHVRQIVGLPELNWGNVVALRGTA